MATHVTAVLLENGENCMFDNMIAHIAKIKDWGPVVVAALDIKAFRLCRNLMRHENLRDCKLYCASPRKDSSLYWVDKRVSFEDPTYFRIVTLKPALLLAVLQFGIPCFLTDVDVVFMRSPFPILHSRAYGGSLACSPSDNSHTVHI